ncbi:MAG: radical SAM protein [Candidatus Aminicenantaceae bacterium]
MMRKGSFYIKQRADRASLRKGSSPLLSNLDLELAERCNNNCIHCYINQPADDYNAKKRELKTEEIKAILEEAASLGCLKVRFTGGEPLLREDFEELYIFARKQGLKVPIFTNATLITPELASLFARIPPLEKVEITAYGMNRKSYEAVSRVPGSYDAAWEGINQLLERKVPFVVKFAILPPNRDEIKEFEAWAASLPWTDSFPTFSMFFDLRCHRDSEEKNRLIKRLRLTPEEGLAILTRRREKYIREMRQFCSKFMCQSGENLFSCGAGAGGGCVDAYGRLQPCLLLRHPAAIYDLKRGTLREAMEDFYPRMRKMKAKNPDYLARCARCFLKGLCEQCPAKSWMEHGSLDTPVDYLCEVAHAQARYLGLLKEGEKAWKVRNWKQRIKNFSMKEPIPQERSRVEARAC